MAAIIYLKSPQLLIDVRFWLRDNEESAHVPGHIRILPKDVEHMLMNKILKLHLTSFS